MAAEQDLKEFDGTAGFWRESPSLRDVDIYISDEDKEKWEEAYRREKEKAGTDREEANE